VEAGPRGRAVNGFVVVFFDYEALSNVRERMLRLTSLAPDIIEAILRGKEPEGMSLEKLRKDLPVAWSEQRERCGG